MDYTRDIQPAFETIGKRRRISGYIATLRDGDTIIHSREYSTYSQGERALDALVYELLIDPCEQGLVDTLPELIDDTDPLPDPALVALVCRAMSDRASPTIPTQARRCCARSVTASSPQYRP